MVQLSAALGVDVKGFANGISDESKQSMDDLSTLHTSVSSPRNEAFVLGENFEGCFFIWQLSEISELNQIPDS